MLRFVEKRGMKDRYAMPAKFVSKFEEVYAGQRDRRIASVSLKNVCLRNTTQETLTANTWNTDRALVDS
jgi:hypothetical protein